VRSARRASRTSTRAWYLAAALLCAAASPARSATPAAPRTAASAAASPDTTRHARHGAAKAKKTRRRPAPKRARVGERVPVEITYYCLQGTTRTDRPTREGIVAADPRVFPLRRHVELFVGGESLGRFLVDDTGGLIRGHVVDVWVPSCDDARHRGRRYGEAVLLKKGARVKLAREKRQSSAVSGQ
jgi:3D (Asp-Asp-Asp) domain-containing protein